MKILKIILLPMLMIFISCGNDETNSQNLGNNISQLQSNTRAGIVKEKLDAGSYSYLRVEENEEEYWIAVPTMPIKVDETVYFSQYMEMKEFKSETLNRTFESVLFVSDAGLSPNKEVKPTGHTGTNQLNKEDISVEKVEGGMTISEIYKDKKLLKGKTIKVRGTVVKFNSGIMNRNWIHIQDGTSDGDNYDLLLTSDETAAVGNVIVAEGELVIDKDFGAGYSYSVLLENTKIIK